MFLASSKDNFIGRLELTLLEAAYIFELLAELAEELLE